MESSPIAARAADARRLSKAELAVILLAVAFGSWSIPFWTDWKEISYNNYIHSQYVYVAMNFAVSSALFWIALSAMRVSEAGRLPAALWAGASWNVWFPSLLAYIGFLLLPVEIALAAVLLRWRSGVGWARAFAVSLGTKALVLSALQPRYVTEFFHDMKRLLWAVMAELLQPR